MNFLQFPQLSAVLARFEALTRAGLPAVLALPEWGAGETAPDGHLVPEGTALYTTDIPSSPVAPCLLLHIPEDPQPTDDDETEQWAVRCHAEIRLPFHDAEQIGAVVDQLSALYAGDFSLSGGGSPEQNWSGAALTVDLVIKEVPSFVREDGANEVEGHIDFVLHCRFPAPAA